MAVYQRVRKDAKGRLVRGKWVAERMVEGRRQRLEFDKKAEARRQSDRWKRGEGAPPPAVGPGGGGAGPSLREFIPAARQAVYVDLAPDYADGQEAYMQQFCDWAKADAGFEVGPDWADQPALMRWRDHLAASRPLNKADATAKLAPSTVNSKLAAVRNLLNYLHTRGRRKGQAPEVRQLKVRNEMVSYLTEAEEDRLVAALRERGEEECADFVRVACMTGMRLGELLGLHPGDVRPAQVVLRKQKNGRVGTLPITPLVGRILKRRVPWTLTRNALRSRIYRTVEALGWRACGDERLEGFRLHSLRHTMGTRLNAGGVDLPTIQGLMRHSTIKMTTRYVHSSPEQERAAVAVLSRELPEDRAA